jgi:tetratricopeptide (TPR) repeat protein
MADDGKRAGGLPEGYAYRAFISYSHRDKAHVRRLHREVESYRIPPKLVGKVTAVGEVPRRLSPVFRDRDELPASSDLGTQLRAAIRGSMFLIVICSPASAKSHWVNQEIINFKRAHGEGNLLALIVDGVPYGSDTPGKEDEECFPQALRYVLGPDGELTDERTEPIAADLRPEADGPRLARLKLIAGLTGLKLDELVQRETQRRMRRLALVASGAMAGMVLTGGLAFYANAARIEANEQRKVAQKEAAAARAASDFLVGTFELSNPATENPRTVTALTILGRSAERARTDLADQPAIQTRMLATLGRAYNNLGLVNEARTAFEQSLPAIEKAGPDGAEAMAVLAATYAKQGSLDKALATVKRAEAMLGPDKTQNLNVRASAATIEGRILNASSQVKPGLAAYDRALAYYRAMDNAPPVAIAGVLNNQGLLLSDDGQYAAAEKSLNESLAIYQRTLGAGHLSTGKAWYALAQNAFNAGKFPSAEMRIANALKVERAVLDADNPSIADTLSIQGQILQGRGKLPEAERALREAVTIYRKAYGRHYLIGIDEVYLGLIQGERGSTAEALATFDDAKKNYDASYGKIHPNHGDLLVNRATVLAKAGRMEEARKDCAAGIAILKETLGADASFTKSNAATCAALGGKKT